MAKAKKTTKRARKPTKTTKAPRNAAASKGAALPAADLSLKVSEAEREGWRATGATLADDELGLGVPLAVLLGEAIDVARFVRARWEAVLDPKTRAVVVPGLSSAVRKSLAVAPFAARPVLHAGTAHELVVLHALVQEEQTRALLSASSSGGAAHPRIEGASLVSDLRDAAESFLDDGVETDEDARLRAVNDAHADEPGSDDELASALMDYAALAESLRPEIDGYADFSPAWIDRARELAAALRASPASPAPPSGRGLAERDGLAALLLRRIRLVRAKARFVFREHPAIVREVTSAYERRRRAAHKRAAKAQEKAPKKVDGAIADG